MNITSLSASMVNTYRQCPFKFYCQYCLRLPRRSNMALAFGSSFHETAEENYYQKIRTQKDLPVDLLECFFVEDLECRDDVDWKEQEQSLDQTKDQGVRTVRAYQQKIAPSVMPKLVEHVWSMEVGGRDWCIRGKTDLIDSNDKVIDLKTTNKRLSKPYKEQIFQVGVYAMAWKVQTGCQNVKGRIDYAIRGKDDIYSHPVSFNGDLNRSVLTTFDDVARRIQREEWPPFRGHYLCSRKYCNFADQCEEECGGTVT